MFIIGIAGGSGSGKSTMAAALQERLGAYGKVCLFGADRWFIHPLPQMLSPVTGNWMDDYNCPESIDYDAMVDAIEAETQADILIVEGNGILYPQKVRDLLDLKIFLELPIEERMYRRIDRNIKAGRGTMQEIADFYLQSARFSEAKWLLPTVRYADIRLGGDNWQGKGLDMVEAYVAEQLKR
ncbi:MAG: AAA family ATPase [Clostridiales bacterium]|nr:AAA family ATPase [Clostridiales bacterium]